MIWLRILVLLFQDVDNSFIEDYLIFNKGDFVVFMVFVGSFEEYIGNFLNDDNVVYEIGGVKYDYIDVNGNSDIIDIIQGVFGEGIFVGIKIIGEVVLEFGVFGVIEFIILSIYIEVVMEFQ